MLTPTTPKPVNQHFTATAIPIPNYEKHRVGKDVSGSPLLLIAVSDQDNNRRARPVSIALQHLTVQHNLRCRVTQPDGAIENDHFTVITCKGLEHSLIAYFLRVLEPLIAVLGPNPSRQDISQMINQLVDLFKVLEAAPRKTVQGLWAELYLMARSNEPTILVKSWHTTSIDRYDFNAGSQRIEVKSASGRLRQHHFSLEQLQPPSGTVLLIASLFVERAGGGVSVAELMEQIYSRISGNLNLSLHFEKVVAQTLGSDWRDVMTDKFDQQLAEQSLVFYEPNAVPGCELVLPNEVSEVHFKADLGNKNRANYPAYRALGGLFQATLK